MLSFFTEFPVIDACTYDEFNKEIKNWVLKSPHSNIVNEDFPNRYETEEKIINSENQKILVIKDSNNNIGYKNIVYDRSLTWETIITHSTIDGNPWVSIRVSVESNSPIIRLPESKKPIICKNLVSKFGGSYDGELMVQDSPHFLNDSDLNIAKNIIESNSSNRLPIVYVSKPFRGKWDIDVNKLAYDLSGMAHVVVEPTRDFSKNLMKITFSKNVYGGSIGIYWPNVSQRKTFFSEQFSNDKNSYEKSITEYVKKSLLNRRPLAACTWSSIQLNMASHNYNSLKNSKSADLDKYILNFDSEMFAKNEKLEESEKEISRLSSELKRYEEESGYKSYLKINCGTSQDLYNGETSSIIIDLIKAALENSKENSRVETILKEIVNNNEYPEERNELKNSIKNCLRNYRKFDAKIRRELEDIGFTISEDGKHYKLTLFDDKKLVFTASKTPSDNRSGLNLSSVICSMI